MKDIQNEIDRLRRENLTLQLAATAVHNQINRAPTPFIKEAQEKLLMAAAVETLATQDAIERLARIRDGKQGIKRAPVCAENHRPD